MRNTYTAAARAAHAPGDDTLARALKEALNSRALRVASSSPSLRASQSSFR